MWHVLRWTVSCLQVRCVIAGFLSELGMCYDLLQLRKLHMMGVQADLNLDDQSAISAVANEMCHQPPRQWCK